MQLEINKRILEIRENQTELNRFVEEYKPFVLAKAQKVLNRFIDCNNDDEWSIALFAFNEAIYNYQVEKGSFLSFSQIVIKARLADYYRKEIKHKNIESFNYPLTVGEELDISQKQAVEDFKESNHNELRVMEIQQLAQELKNWDIRFEDLIKVSPKRASTRKLYNSIVKFILSDSEVLDYIFKKKCIPISEIEKNTLIPRKKIERSRKYIISVLLIILGDYQYIRDYINLEVEYEGDNS